MQGGVARGEAVLSSAQESGDHGGLPACGIKDPGGSANSKVPGGSVPGSGVS